LKREILITADGSSTIHLPEWDEHYHSKHGAIQEAYHVFINNGLYQFKKANKISILEIGFGTGLNAFITYLEAKKLQLNIDYTGVEAYPVVPEEIQKLNYVARLNVVNEQAVFEKMHSLSWSKKHTFAVRFSLTKKEQFFDKIDDVNKYDLIYFDAFGARVQPELWTVEIFNIMYKALRKDGVLVTYSAKGSVRRAMQEVGFIVERLPGPPGKREMLRGKK